MRRIFIISTLLSI